jgi:hypothetical protein
VQYKAKLFTIIHRNTKLMKKIMIILSTGYGGGVASNASQIKQQL